MKDKTIGVDLAKNVFEIGISDRPGHVAETLRLSRTKFLPFFVDQEPATVVMEACGSSHYWGREIGKLGHTVKLISPQYVKPYVQRDKNDRNDVKGLLEAHRNSALHPVPVKTVAQQQLTALHRIRSRWMATRIGRINTLRGLLREFGFIIPVGARHVIPGATELIEDAEVDMPPVLREVFHEMCTEIRELEGRLQSVEKRLEALASQTPAVARLRSIPGIGLLTATAMVGFVGDVERFRSSRHFASYLGLTPREHSSGNVRRLGRDQQARRCVSPDDAHSRRTFPVVVGAPEKHHTVAAPAMGSAYPRTARVQQGDRSSGEQAGPSCMGRLETRLGLSGRLSGRLNR